jgi:hypothetical protein
MNKKVLIETQLFTPNKVSLTEGKLSDNGNPLVEGILATVEVKNGNGRYYPKELWQREINNYMSCVKENRALGELDHPDSTIINLKNVSHNIKKIWWDGDNIMGMIEILPTPSGNILKELLKNNITVGVSSRGMGSLKDIGGINEVQQDFMLAAVDIVADPSAPSAFVNGIMEGAEWVWDNGILREKEIEEMRQEVERTSRRDREQKTLQIFERFMRGLS